MRPEPEVLEDALTRLAKIEGQVAGIARMLREGRDCREVIGQIAAAGSALDRVGYRLIASGMQRCATEGSDSTGITAEELERLFLRIA